MTIFWYRLLTLFRYSVIAVLAMAFLDQLANFSTPPYITLPFAAIVGFFFGLYYLTLGIKSLKRFPFLGRILIQMLIVQVIIMVAVLLLDFVSAEFGKKLLGEYVVDNLFAREFLPVYYKMQIFIFILLFFLEIELILGRKFLTHYLLGKYNRPKKEHRIFMFLDLTGSTGLAESLGDDKYYQLLNDCYRLLSDPVIRTQGEVLKYVGDEVILSWPYKTGLKRNQCMELFYTFQEALVANDVMFQRRYGVLPRFKAGVHEGEVIAAYLGEIRKQLDFSGDVMNTTARIAGACNTYGADLLLSERLFHALPLRNYGHSPIGEVELKGKTVKISLVKLTGRKE